MSRQIVEPNEKLKKNLIIYIVFVGILLVL